MSVGAYATKTAMLANFGNSELVQSTNLDVPVGPDPISIDDDVLDNAMLQANSKVDGYVQAKYPLPLAEIPPSLVEAACALTRFQLWKSRASERVVTGNDAAISFLKDVARGLVSLGPTGSGSAPVQNASAVAFVDPADPTYTAETLNSYRNPGFF